MKESTKKLKDSLFDVELADVFIEVPKSNSQPTLFPEESTYTNTEFQKVERFKAIHRTEDDYVFSVVAPDYKLISNAEAIELGYECFKQIFKVTNQNDMEFYNLIMPKSRSFCHIDFKHEKSAITPFDDDTWFPYLRVTNSYNRTFALKFDIGFCRGICMNGVIFGKKNIVFKFYHSHRTQDPQIQFNVGAEEIASWESDFIEALHNLKRYHVPPKYMRPLVHKVYNIQIHSEPTKRQIITYMERKNHIDDLTDKYFSEMGQNGYAALNVLSDFASRPVGYISADQRINSLQKITGRWIADFVEAIEQKTFNFENYLGDFTELPTYVEA